MVDDAFGIGKACEAFEKGTREIRELAKIYLEPIAKAKGETKAAKIQAEEEIQVIKTMVEADRLLQEAGITERRLNRKIIRPIMEHASCETEEELTTKWAGLLASSVSRSSVHVSFPGILADLTSSEVKILDTLFQWTITWEKTGTWEQSEHTISKLRSQLGFSKDEFRIPVETLIRLRLCQIDAMWSDDAALERDSEVHLRITGLGKAFVAACKGPSKITTLS